MSDITRPIEPFELTQGFGDNPANYAQFGLKGHNGWDLKTVFLDTPQGRRFILSSWNSKFYGKGNEGNGGYGLYFEVIVELKNTWKLTFAHCLSIENFIEKKEGETMGISDSTGNVTGPHLHLTTKKGKLVNGIFQSDNYNNGYFGAIEPQEFFNELRAVKYPNNPVPTDPRTFLGLSKEYWLQVEKDRKDLMVQVGDLNEKLKTVRENTKNEIIEKIKNI